MVLLVALEQVEHQKFLKFKNTITSQHLTFNLTVLDVSGLFIIILNSYQHSLQPLLVGLWLHIVVVGELVVHQYSPFAQSIQIAAVEVVVADCKPF